MKSIQQISIALLAILVLSACGAVNNSIQQNNDDRQTTSTSTTVNEQNSDINNGDPSFIPLYSKFHMGPIISDPSKPLTLKFPLKTNKIKSVDVKIYKVSKDHFIELIKQQTQPEHEGKLNISAFSTSERNPIFSGTQEVHEAGVFPDEPSVKKSYIEITMFNGTEQYNQGYYYFEFESATSSETLKPIGGMPMNSLLEVVETYSGYEDQYDHPIPHN